VSAGCGSAKHGEVSGKVTYQGKPLPGGTVMFWPQGVEAGARPAPARINEDGGYTAPVPVGEVAVTVETESLAGKVQTGIPRVGKSGKSMSGGPPPEILAQIEEKKGSSVRAESNPVSDKYVHINKKYSNPQTSGFKLTVQSGAQEFNIDLK
jgi:hypothetical protein